MRRHKNKVSLLPHTRDNIHGLTPGIGQIYGWEIVKFNIPAQWQYSEGEGVRVAVIDTGCDLDHPDLKDNIIEGVNFIDALKAPQDDNGHGTHVAGTIAASRNSIGMVGVAPKTKIMPIKCLDKKGNGSLDSVIKGILWAADHKADIIAMSLGTSQNSQLLQDAVDYAVNKGSLIFCAAGNEGPNTDIMYPAKCMNTVSIGAIDKNLNRTNFTCSGDTLDFLAPGQDILSCAPKHTYALMSGTSMSNPFAVGCASLALSYKRKQNQNINTYKDIIDLFKTKAKKLTDPRYSGKKQFEGYGIIYPMF